MLQDSPEHSPHVHPEPPAATLVEPVRQVEPQQVEQERGRQPERRIAAILAGAAFGLTGWTLPAFVDVPLALLAQPAIPLSLVALGMSLCEFGVREGWRASLAMTLVKLAVLPAASGLWQPCGVLQLLAGNQAREGDKLAGHPWDGLLARACTPEDASRIAGIALPCAAQFYPGAGWLDAAGFCRQLLAAPGIRLQVQSPVSRLAQDEDGHWQALATDGRALASAPCKSLSPGVFGEDKFTAM